MPPHGLSTLDSPSWRLVKTVSDAQRSQSREQAELQVLVSLTLVAIPSLCVGFIFLSLMVWMKRVEEFGCTYIFSIGAVYGLFGTLLFMSTLDKWGQKTLISWSPTLVTALLLASSALVFIVIKTASCRSGIQEWKKSRLAFCLLLVGFANVVFVLVNNILAPAFGWDAMHWYLPNAVHYLQQELNSGGLHSEFSYPNGKQYIQPMTSSLAAAYTAHVTVANHFSYGGLFIWSMLYLLTSSMIYGAVSVITRSNLAAMIATILFVSSPLIENHAIAGGYLELFLCASVVCSATLIAIGLQKQSPLVIGIGTLSTFTALAMKNSGFLYMMGQWVVLLGVLTFTSKIRYLALVMATMVILAAVFSYSFGFDFDFLGYRFLVKPEFEIVSFGGRTWRPIYTSIAAVTATEIYALVVNSSFSIVFLATALSLGAARSLMLRSEAGLQGSLMMPVFFLGLSAFAFILLLMAAQVSYEYAFSIAKAGQDTGNSRFTLPAVALGAMATGLLFHAVSNSGVARAGYGIELLSRS